MHTIKTRSWWSNRCIFLQSLLYHPCPVNPDIKLILYKRKLFIEAFTFLLSSKFAIFLNPYSRKKILRALILKV